MTSFARTLLPGRRALSVLLVAHLFAVMALAASPGLHHWLHGDADDDDDCAVVLFLHGGLNEAVGPLPVPGFVVQTVGFVPLTLAAREFVPSVFATGAVFEHGPPAEG